MACIVLPGTISLSQETLPPLPINIPMEPGQCLRPCYAMPGTDLAIECSGSVISAISLRACSAMPGTETSIHHRARYRRLPLRSYCLLHARYWDTSAYAMSGAEIHQPRRRCTEMHQPIGLR
eukprot:360610-Rhodomonas_salina.3